MNHSGSCICQFESGAPKRHPNSGSVQRCQLQIQDSEPGARDQDGVTGVVVGVIVNIPEGKKSCIGRKLKKKRRDATHETVLKLQK